MMKRTGIYLDPDTNKVILHLARYNKDTSYTDHLSAEIGIEGLDTLWNDIDNIMTELAAIDLVKTNHT